MLLSHQNNIVIPVFVRTVNINSFLCRSTNYTIVSLLLKLKLMRTTHNRVTYNSYAALAATWKELTELSEIF